VGEVRRSTTRQADARRAPDAATSQHLLPALIHDNGAVVVDRDLPIGGFIEGHATFPLTSHREQLSQLSVS
jgi:hypothetical protein